MPGRPVKTEVTVRTYDAAGELVSETVTTEVKQTTPDSDAPGMYL